MADRNNQTFIGGCKPMLFYFECRLDVLSLHISVQIGCKHEEVARGGVEYLQ